MKPSKDYNLAVGLRIRNIRENLHLSREEFSEKCDISASFLSAVENGKKSITSKTVFKICTAIGVSADYLIMGKDDTLEADIAQEMMNTLGPESRRYAFQILRDYIEAVNALMPSDES